MTKKEIVDMINALPGPEVTMRPRKDTLMEILAEREANHVMVDNVTSCADDMEACECDPCECKPFNMMWPTIIAVVMAAFVIISIIGLWTE